jgi:hypothetical protein
MLAWPTRVVGILGVCVLLWAAPSRAADRTVRVTIVAEAADTSGLEAVFAELLARLPVSLEVTHARALDSTAFTPPAAAPAELLALVWVDLTKPTAATLYLLDVDTDRVLLRKVRREPDRSELVQEELGHILQSSVEGLLAGEPVGVPRQEILPLLDAAPASGTAGSPRHPEPAQPAKPVAPASGEAVSAPANTPVPGGLRAQAMLLYSAGLLAPQLPISHGPELGVLARAGGHLETGVWLGLQWRLPVDVSTGPVTLRYSQLAPRALVIAKLTGNDERTLRFALGGGIDVVRVETRADPDANIGVAAPETSFFAIARAALLFDWRLSGALQLIAALDLDADASDTRYVFSARRGQRVLLEPYPVRPALALGIATP